MKNKSKNKSDDNILLRFLYGTCAGRVLLKPLTAPAVSRIAGRLLDTRMSRIIIKPFIKAAGIDMSQYIDREFSSYNDFFTRRIKDEARPVDMEESHLISPCDAKLTVLKIDPKGVFAIKRSFYTVSGLLRNKRLAKEYYGGYAAIFRLDVSDYHRYSYIDDGIMSRRVRIKGILHTVQPIANDFYPIYHENTREYGALMTKNFGKVVVMEVGAMLVGRIINYHERTYVERGEEKGRFEYGGSTIICLFKNNMVKFDENIMKNSSKGIETKVKLGEKIGNGYEREIDKE